MLSKISLSNNGGDISKVRSVNEDETTTLGVLLKECQEKMHLEILKSNHHCFFTEIDQITTGSSLGCSPGCDAGGCEFETPTGPTLRVFK